MIVKLVDDPVQPLDVGVTVIVATSSIVPVFVTANDVIVPLPAAARPILIFEFVQLYVVPLTAPLNVTVVVDPLLHTTWLDGVTTVGVGCTVIVKLVDAPVQPLAVGVTVIVATWSVVPLFTAVNDAILPVPLPARLILVLLFVQLYVVPLTAPLKVTAVVDPLLHTTWLDGVTTVGVGCTVIVNDDDVPTQPATVGVTVIVATWSVVPLFVAVNTAISPLPLAERPILALVFVHAKLDVPVSGLVNDI